MEVPHYDEWSWRPLRSFPAKVWLEARYPFRITAPLARLVDRSNSFRAPQQRLFPALVWLRARQAGFMAAPRQEAARSGGPMPPRGALARQHSRL